MREFRPVYQTVKGMGPSVLEPSVLDHTEGSVSLKLLITKAARESNR